MPSSFYTAIFQLRSCWKWVLYIQLLYQGRRSECHQTARSNTPLKFSDAEEVCGMTSSTPQNGVYAQLEHLQARYVGTGHPETTQHEWATNQHRDSIASYLGHHSLVEYFAIAEGISAGRAKLNLMERMHRPCGEPPKKRKIEAIEE